MIERTSFLKAVRIALANNPICALLGPRQCGKATLARELAATRKSHFFDLESALGRARLADPELALGSRRYGIEFKLSSAPSMSRSLHMPSQISI
jgi:uncharacterized protein